MVVHGALIGWSRPNGTVADAISQHATAGRPFDDELVTLWARQISSALAYIHSWRVLHRDLKSANIFIDALGNALVVRPGREPNPRRSPLLC